MKPRTGVTLIEMLMVVAILSILMVTIMPYFGAISRIWEYGDAQTEMLQQGRVAADRMVRALRVALDIIDIDTPLDLSAASQNNFIEFINQDGDTIAFFHNVPEALGSGYYDNTLDDNDLIMRTYDTGGSPVHSVLAKAVDNIDFIYLGEDMNALNVASAATLPYHTCAVRIELNFADTASGTPSSLPISTTAFCRLVTTTDAGGVWAGDYSHGHVIKFGPSGVERVRKTYTGGNVWSVAYSPLDDSCWVSVDFNELEQLDSNGNRLTYKTSYIKRATQIAVNPSDSSCYVANTLGPHETMRVDTTGAEVFRIFSGDRPLSISVNPTDGSCWVGHLRDNGVVKITANGARLFDTPNFSLGNGRVSGVSVDPTDGTCWATDTMNGQVVKLDPGGGELYRVGGFSMPYSLAVYPTDSSVWVGDTGSRQLVKLNSDGTIAQDLSGNQIRINDVGGRSVSVDSANGSCWVADPINHRLLKFDSNGSMISEIDYSSQAATLSITAVSAITE